MSQEKPFEMNFEGRKVCVGYPSPELIDYRFHCSLLEMVTQTSQFVKLGITNAVSSRIAVNRNTIVDNARQLGCTDILWIDADTKFPINGLLRLLLHDKDIVCATTCRRDGKDHAPICLPMDLSVVGKSEKMIKMKNVGFPFMLTKMSVFDKLKRPYFAEPARWMAGVDGLDEVVGEDEYFCNAAIAAGFDIWCDMELSMEIGHIGSSVHYVENEEVGRVDLTI